MDIFHSRARSCRRAPKPSASRVDSRLASEKGQDQRENYTQDNGRRERKVKREVAAPDRNVARQTPQRDAGHDQQAEAGDDETNEDERFTHCVSHHKGHDGHKGTEPLCSIRSDRCQRKSIRSRTRPPPVHRIHAWHCARSTARTPCGGSPRRPWRGRSPPSASATS